MKSIDLLGLKWGKLTVVERLGSRSGQVWWKCSCECGGTTELPTSACTRGRTRSCGCLMHKGKPLDLTGQVLGGRKVLRRAPSVGKYIYWECECVHCGLIHNVRASLLRRDYTISCGCVHQAEKLEDLTGKVFGYWRVLHIHHRSCATETNKRTSVAWWCLCTNCGVEKAVLARSLRGGVSVSCGCSRLSRINAELGNKYNYLTINSRAENVNSNGNACFVLCTCDCGNTVIVDLHKVTSGHTKSCGCYQATLKGVKSATYNPSITDEERAVGRFYPEYHAWRKNVFSRDDYTCQLCGKRGGTLAAHHLYSYAEYKDLRTTPSNGITLCERCHKDFHNTHGRKQNTYSEFYEYAIHNYENPQFLISLG